MSVLPPSSQSPKKKDREVSAAALDRYAHLSLVLSFIAQGYDKAQAIAAAADIPLTAFGGRVRYLSPRTLYRWHARYQEGGLSGLENPARVPLHGSRVFPEVLLEFIVSEHSRDPQSSVPELIRRAHVKGLIHPKQKVRPGSLWRVLKRMGVDVTRKADLKRDELRRFSHVERMRLVIVDGKHFRAGKTEAKRVALYFLDDATRFGLTAIAGTAESGNLFLKGLHTLIQRYGLPSVLFTDHGSAFVNDTVKKVLGRLGLPMINGTVGHPEGRGKIERFNRSVNERLLRTFRGNPSIDPECKSLTLRLEHDLSHVYNHLSHESLGNESPQKRWNDSLRPLEPVAESLLSEAFTLPIKRKVANDLVVKVAGVLLELPKGYGGKTVTLHRRVLEDDAIYLAHEGRMIKLHEVQPHLNAITHRTPQPLVESKNNSHSDAASSIAFERTFAPLVGADGGFGKDSGED